METEIKLILTNKIFPGRNIIFSVHYAYGYFCCDTYFFYKEEGIKELSGPAVTVPIDRLEIEDRLEYFREHGWEVKS